VSEREFGVQSYPDVLLEAPEFDPDQPMPGFLGGNTLVADLDEDAIDRIVSFREANPASVVLLRSLGGAYGDVAQDDSAFPARNATWFAMAGAFDIPGMVDDDARARALAAWDAIEASGSGVYGNFTVSTDPSYAARIYPPATMARLAAVKRTWDPGNVFCRNHNVQPGGDGRPGSDGQAA
jgi:hypothetical protein